MRSHRPGGQRVGSTGQYEDSTVRCVSRLLGQTPPRFRMDSIIPLYSLKGKGWLTPPQWRSRRQIELA